MKYLFLLFLLPGCYTEFGMGYAGGGTATVHGSAGFIVHFDEDRVALRAGGGGAIGGYEPDGAEDGTNLPGPVVVGGHVQVVGGRKKALVVTADGHLPLAGRIDRESTGSKGAPATRIFAGLGYRHVWWRAPSSDGPPRRAASVVTALGPEVFWGEVDDRASTRVGGAFSVMFTLHSWHIGEVLDCMLSKSGTEPGCH